MSSNNRRLATTEINYPSFAVELPDNQVQYIDRALSSLTLYTHQVHFDTTEILDGEAKWKRLEHVESEDFYAFYAGTSAAAAAYRKEQNISAVETGVLDIRPSHNEESARTPPALPERRPPENAAPAQPRQEHTVPGAPAKHLYKVPPPYIPPTLSNPENKTTTTPVQEEKIRRIPPPPPRRLNPSPSTTPISQTPSGYNDIPHGGPSGVAEIESKRQKQLLGEALYPQIHAMQPELAGKITGMILEMSEAEIVHLLEDKVALALKVNEAITVYGKYVGSLDLGKSKPEFTKPITVGVNPYGPSGDQNKPAPLGGLVWNPETKLYNYPQPPPPPPARTPTGKSTFLPPPPQLPPRVDNPYNPPAQVYNTPPPLPLYNTPPPVPAYNPPPPPLPPVTLQQNPHRTPSGFAPGSYHGGSTQTPPLPPVNTYQPPPPPPPAYHGAVSQSYYPPPPNGYASQAPTNHYAPPPPGNPFQAPPIPQNYQSQYPPEKTLPMANVTNGYQPTQYNASTYPAEKDLPKANVPNVYHGHVNNYATISAQLYHMVDPTTGKLPEKDSAEQLPSQWVTKTPSTVYPTPPPYDTGMEPYTVANRQNSIASPKSSISNNWDAKSTISTDSKPSVYGDGEAEHVPSHSQAPKPGHVGSLPHGARASHQNEHYLPLSTSRIPAWYTQKEQEGNVSVGQTNNFDVKVPESNTSWGTQTLISGGYSNYAGKTYAVLANNLDDFKAEENWEGAVSVGRAMADKAEDRETQLDALQEVGEALLYNGSYDEAETLALEILEGRKYILNPSAVDLGMGYYRCVALLMNVCDLKGIMQLGQPLGNTYCAILPPSYSGPIWRNARHEWLLSFSWYISPDGRQLLPIDPVPTFSVTDIAFDSLYEGDVHVLRLALRMGVIVNNRGVAAGWTLLATAASLGFLDAVESLLSHGADVNVKCIDGYTALMAAAGFGDLHIMQLLISRGAKIREKTQTSRLQPIHYAASGGHYDCTAFLLERGAPTCSIFHSEPTPLHYAALAKSIPVMEVLYRYHATNNIADSGGQYPIHWAAQGGSAECVLFLLNKDKGRNIDRTDRGGMTPLDHGIMSGHFEVVIRLVERGANIRRPRVLPWNYYTRTEEEIAAMEDKSLERREIWKYLEARGSAINFLSVDEEASMIAEDTVASDFMSRRLQAGYQRPY